jgi:hypothetical protein
VTDEMRYDIGLEEIQETQEIPQKQTKAEGAKNVFQEEYGLHLVLQDIRTAAELIRRIIFPPKPSKSWQVSGMTITDCSFTPRRTLVRLQKELQTMQNLLMWVRILKYAKCPFQTWDPFLKHMSSI